jgi:hypothetical protein
MDLPPAKSEGKDIMDDGSEMATAMNEFVTTFNMQGHW